MSDLMENQFSCTMFLRLVYKVYKKEVFEPTHKTQISFGNLGVLGRCFFGTRPELVVRNLEFVGNPLFCLEHLKQDKRLPPS